MVISKNAERLFVQVWGNWTYNSWLLGEIGWVQGAQECIVQEWMSLRWVAPSMRTSCLSARCFRFIVLSLVLSRWTACLASDPFSSGPRTVKLSNTDYGPAFYLTLRLCCLQKLVFSVVCSGFYTPVVCFACTPIASQLNTTRHCNWYRWKSSRTPGWAMSLRLFAINN